MVCLRNICINILHKGDDDDDDDDDDDNNNNNNNNNNNDNNNNNNNNSDNKQGTCMSIADAIPGDTNVNKREVEKMLWYRDLTIGIHCYVEYKSKSVTGNNRGYWNHFKITQTIPKQHTRKARN